MHSPCFGLVASKILFLTTDWTTGAVIGISEITNDGVSYTLENSVALWTFNFNLFRSGARQLCQIHLARSQHALVRNSSVRSPDKYHHTLEISPLPNAVVLPGAIQT